MNRRHHRSVDIPSARGPDVLTGARLGLRRTGITIEKQRASHEAGQRHHRGFVCLVGGDDGEHSLGPRDRFGRARSAEHVRRDVVGSLRCPNLRVGRIGLDVVGAYARREVRIGAPAVEKGARSLAEPEKRDGAYCVESGMGAATDISFPCALRKRNA
jgi:hypothetical protein